LEDYVKAGGGLAWIAGERNIYVDKKGAPDDPLERTLPAKIAPPRSPEGTAVVLIIDKSSSMEGRKIELARLAAIGVVENLRPIDFVGVLIFDNSFQWAVNLRRAEDKPAIKRQIAGITPDGGTQIAPALTEAYQRILPQSAAYKHIVLLTDGISEEGDTFSLTKEATTNHVTISTVGLGQDVNRAFLEKLAAAAGGKSYFLNDPSGLEQILLRDVEEHTGSNAVEKPITAVVLNPSPRCAATCASNRVPLPTSFSRRIKKTRCWSAGSTGWAAPWSSLPTPRTAGPPTGSPGPASTACGPTSSATCSRTLRKARPPPISTAPRTSWSSITVSPTTCRSPQPSPISTPWAQPVSRPRSRSPKSLLATTAAVSRSVLTRDCSASVRWPIRAPSLKWASTARKRK